MLIPLNACPVLPSYRSHLQLTRVRSALHNAQQPAPALSAVTMISLAASHLAARAFGIKAGMFVGDAFKLCPQLLVVGAGRDMNIGFEIASLSLSPFQSCMQGQSWVQVSKWGNMACLDSSSTSA